MPTTLTPLRDIAKVVRSKNAGPFEITLDIVFKDPAKVQYKGKNANEVWLRVKDDAAVGPAKYTAKNMSTGKSRDPEIVIEP